MGKYDIFISYRRSDTADKAELLQNMLCRAGYKEEQISFDRENLSGKFDIELINRIDKCKDFIVVIGKNSLECFEDSNGCDYTQLSRLDIINLDVKLLEYYEKQDFTVDFMRLEIMRAIYKHKHIIPIVPYGSEEFDFYKMKLPKELIEIKREHAILYSTDTNVLFADLVRAQMLKRLYSKPSQPLKWFIVVVLALVMTICLVFVINRAVVQSHIKIASDAIEYHYKHRGEPWALNRLNEAYDILLDKGYIVDDSIMVELKECIDEY